MKLDDWLRLTNVKSNDNKKSGHGYDLHGEMQVYGLER